MHNLSHFPRDRELHGGKMEVAGKPPMWFSSWSAEAWWLPQTLWPMGLRRRVFLGQFLRIG